MARIIDVTDGDDPEADGPSNDEATRETPPDTYVEFGDTVSVDGSATVAIAWDDWEVLEQLGAGGMGTVFKVRLPTGQVGALKTMHPHLAQDAGLRARFLRETQLLEHMNGSYFPALLGARPDADVPWMVCDFIDAATLQAAIQADGPLGGSKLESFASDLLDAVEALHQQHVVHRDLKPSNLLMRDGTPVLIDLGVARADDMSSLTSTGTVLGSPGWMAPEQLVATSDPTSAIDIYGWGAVVAYAAQGRPPFGTGTPAEVSQRVLTGNADLDDLPDIVRPTVTAALQTDPGARPLIPDLRAALRSRDRGAKAFPVTDAPSPPGTAASAPAKGRWPRRVALLAAIVSVAALAVGAATRTGGGDEAATSAPETTTTSTSPPTTRPTTTSTAPPRSPLETTDWANRTYRAECGDGPISVDLVDGQWDRNPADPGAEKVQLDQVHRFDVDRDDTDEAIVELICDVGANTVYNQALLFDDADGSLTNIGPTIYGEELETDGVYIVTTDPTFGPSDPLCCPSGYENNAYEYRSSIPGFGFVATWGGRPAWMDLAEFGSFEGAVSAANAAPDGPGGD